MKIVTNFWMKPIPLRQFDWSAVTDNYDGAPDAGRQPIGYGSTKAEAVDDLIGQLSDWDEEAAAEIRRELEAASEPETDPDHEWLDDMAFERAHAWGRS